MTTCIQIYGTYVRPDSIAHICNHRAFVVTWEAESGESPKAKEIDSRDNVSKEKKVILSSAYICCGTNTKKINKYINYLKMK